MKILKKMLKNAWARASTSLKVNLNKVRTGRAHPSLLDNITRLTTTVHQRHLNQVGNISVPDARTISDYSIR